MLVNRWTCLFEGKKMHWISLNFSFLTFKIREGTQKYLRPFLLYRPRSNKCHRIYSKWFTSQIALVLIIFTIQLICMDTDILWGGTHQRVFPWKILYLSWVLSHSSRLVGNACCGLVWEPGGDIGRRKVNQLSSVWGEEFLGDVKIFLTLCACVQL